MSDYTESQPSSIGTSVEPPASAKMDFDALRKQMEERHQASWDDLGTGRSEDMPSDLRAEHRREAAALELDRAAYGRGEPLPSVVAAELRATQPIPYREASHFRSDFEAEYGQPAIDLARKHWDEYEAHRTGNGQAGDTYADLKRRQDLEEVALGKAIDAERTPGAPLTAAERAEVEQIEARWRKIEATPEFREMEASVEAHIHASRIGDAYEDVGGPSPPTQETAIERAAAMQHAREHAFTHQPIKDSPAHEQHHASAATLTAQHTF